MKLGFIYGVGNLGEKTFCRVLTQKVTLALVVTETQRGRERGSEGEEKSTERKKTKRGNYEMW